MCKSWKNILLTLSNPRDHENNEFYDESRRIVKLLIVVEGFRVCWRCGNRSLGVAAGHGNWLLFKSAASHNLRIGRSNENKKKG